MTDNRTNRIAVNSKDKDALIEAQKVMFGETNGVSQGFVIRMLAEQYVEQNR
jgi:hypothetical protein